MEVKKKLFNFQAELKGNIEGSEESLQLAKKMSEVNDLRGEKIKSSVL